MDLFEYIFASINFSLNNSFLGNLKFGAVLSIKIHSMLFTYSSFLIFGINSLNILLEAFIPVSHMTHLRR